MLRNTTTGQTARVPDNLLDEARSLLGARLVRDDVTLRITEVEAYAGADDPASHAFRGPTPRTEVMFGPPARLYVYFSYGMHWCANVVCGPAGTAAAVLLRAGAVESGMETVRRRRGVRLAGRDLARGPARLTACLAISGDDNGTDLLRPDGLHLEPREGSGPVIAQGPRVGVSHAAEVPWRFWVDGDPSVSVYRRSQRAPR